MDYQYTLFSGFWNISADQASLLSGRNLKYRSINYQDKGAYRFESQTFLQRKKTS